MPFSPSSAPSSGPSARVGRDQHAGEPGQRARERERGQHDALARHAQQRGRARVLADRAHHRAGAGHGQRALDRDAGDEPDRQHLEAAHGHRDPAAESERSRPAEGVWQRVGLLRERQPGQLADQQPGGQAARCPADHVGRAAPAGRARNGRTAST